MTRDTKGNIIYGLLWGGLTALGITGWDVWIDHKQFSLSQLMIRLGIFCVVGAGFAPFLRRHISGS